MGCCTLTTPFLYLGVKVGGSMSRIKAWDEIEAKLHSRLSKWKMKTLSSGGRLTILKSVLGSSPVYYMSIYKVPSKVLKCLEDIRRNFFIGADVKEKKMFIRAVHGNSGGIETHSRVSYSSTWLSIVNEVNKMRNKGTGLLKYMKIQVGNGLNTKFWEDVWMGNKNFKTSFPRIYALESDKNLTVADKMAHNDVAFSLRRQPRDGVEIEQFRALSIVIEGVLMHDMVDRWKWTLDGSGEFSVASARKFIDNSRLIGSPKKTRWIKMVPIKVNIFAWKVQFDLLPTRLNLSRRDLLVKIKILFSGCFLWWLKVD
nr:RNA-directed DNA polymerase, eukaryota, reverse transcriptase zinc-binding domain protein [Tanacetum cinerariifolium]